MTGFLGVCDKIRRTPDGERFWQAMMGAARAVDPQDLLDRIDLSAVLDPDETADQWLDALQPERFCTSTVDGAAVWFIQAAGFEYVWT